MTIGKISQPLKEALGYYSEGVTIPQATNVDGANGLQSGQTNGQLEIVLIAKTTITIADLDIVTLSVTSSATEGGTFVALGTSSFTAAGITIFDEGDIITSFVIPTNEGVKEWTEVNIATDDAAATGTFDCALRLIVK